MPAKSKQQLKLIYALRGKYKTKEDAPEKYKWAFDKKWTDNVKMKNLPTYEQFLNEGAQRDMNNLAMYLIDLNKELAAETNPKTIKFIKKDIERVKADLEKIKSKVNEAADPEVLAAIETVKKVKFGSKRKEAMAIVLAAAKAKTGESARTYKQALQFLDLEDL